MDFISADFILGFISGVIVPVVLFIINHFFIDKGKLNINKKDYCIKAHKSDGWGGTAKSPLVESEDPHVNIKLTLKLLLSNSGKRKLSVTTLQIENNRLEEPIILSPQIVELDVGASKEEVFEVIISYHEANTLIYDDSILKVIDNKGNSRILNIGEATT